MPIVIHGSAARAPSGVFRVVVSKTGAGTEVAYVATNGFYRPGSSNFGLTIQAEGVTVTVDTTLAKEKDAINPDPAMQANINWDAAGNATVTTPLVLSSSLATALKLSFPVGAGSCTIASL